MAFLPVEFVILTRFDEVHIPTSTTNGKTLKPCAAAVNKNCAIESGEFSTGALLRYAAVHRTREYYERLTTWHLFCHTQSTQNEQEFHRVLATIILGNNNE